MVVTGYEFLKRCQPDEISPGIRSVDLTTRIDYYRHLEFIFSFFFKEKILEKIGKENPKRVKIPDFLATFSP